VKNGHLATAALALTSALAVPIPASGTVADGGRSSPGRPPCLTPARVPLALPEFPVCRPGPAPKPPKSYPAGQPAPKRRGLELPAATLFDVHRREALTVFPGAPPDEGVLARFFRCRGFGEPGHLDPRLLEAALGAAAEFRSARIEIVSAYRSPKFNDALGKKARRVAGESRHTRGQALDLRLAGVPAAKLGAWFREHFDGGVGTYPKDGFVHIDVGPKRRWQGL
jgi:hypothetical protein